MLEELNKLKNLQDDTIHSFAQGEDHQDSSSDDDRPRTELVPDPKKPVPIRPS